MIAHQNAVPKPSYLSWEEAGVLSLSALTAYRALFTRGKLQSGQRVLIPGIGGGVATFAAMMATAAGAQVTVTSRSDKKRAQALELGVAQALASDDDWTQRLGTESIDLIVESVGPALFDKYYGVIKPGGTIVVYGSSSGSEITIPAIRLYFPQLDIRGTSMGSGEEYAAMLEFMENHRLKPVVDAVYPLADVASAFDRMKQGDQFGNIALAIP